MEKLNSLFNKARDVASTGYARAGVAMTMGMATVPAFAGPLADGFVAEADDGKADLWLIGGAVIGVCVICFLIGRARKASS